MRIRTKRTSVLIVDTKGNDSKVRLVPTHLLVHWRKYSFLFAFLIVAFFVLSGFIIYQKTSKDYEVRLAHANRVRSMIDIKKVQSSFQSIDEGIYRVNNFLEDKGLQNMLIENAGGLAGRSEIDITKINEFADFYDAQIIELEEKLTAIPLAVPHPGKITSSFGFRRNPFGGRGSEYHSGLDIKGATGDSIKAAGSGKVVFAGYKGGYGKCVVIDHSNKLQTLYGHLHSISVKEGDMVESEQMIGKLGSTGRSTGSHLHYEIIHKGKNINPEEYLSK